MTLRSLAASTFDDAFAIGDSVIPVQQIDREDQPLADIQRTVGGTATSALTVYRGWLPIWRIRTLPLPVADIETIEGLLETAGPVTVNGTQFNTDESFHVVEFTRTESAQDGEKPTLTITLQDTVTV